MENATVEQKAWPFIEARRIYEKIKGKTPAKGFVLFDTGYGPSGLPHIGTFGEVARTAMVQHCFNYLYKDIPTKLYAFSDDLDGLRKVPDNIPNSDMVKKYIGMSLSNIPDPFGERESYAHYMNNKLCEFLDKFNFQYEFKSSTECYKSGAMNEALKKVLDVYDEIMSILLPTLGEERQLTYSPFLPICKETGVVLQVRIIEHDTEHYTITYLNQRNEKVVTSILDGNCKLQWKADWAMRWYGLDVDYEMYGKDLIPAAELSIQICRAMGSNGPVLYNYEHFLDDNGNKISKSKGNGISIEEWLEYAPPESLSLFMYQTPKRAKRLFFDVIPKNVDEYIQYNQKYFKETKEQQMENPLWHLHFGNVPEIQMFGLSFSLLLNLAAACNPEDKAVLWGFITKYANGATHINNPWLDKLVDYALKYYNNFIQPNKKYKLPNDVELAHIRKLYDLLQLASEESSAEDFQKIIYNVGMESGMELKDFFKLLYETLLGQTTGPRLGSFIKLYGKKESLKLIKKAIN